MGRVPCHDANTLHPALQDLTSDSEATLNMCRQLKMAGLCFTELEFWDIAWQLSSALSHFHSLNGVHFDVKVGFQAMQTRLVEDMTLVLGELAGGAGLTSMLSA